MQESHTPVPGSADTKCAPLHNEIAQCARNLWVQQGQPPDRDQAIWLEAEQRLHSATQSPREENSGPTPSLGLPPENRAPAFDGSTIQAVAPALLAASISDPAERCIITCLGGGATPTSSLV